MSTPPEKTPSLINFMDVYVEMKKKKVSKGTRKIFQSNLNALSEIMRYDKINWLPVGKITFRDLDPYIEKLIEKTPGTANQVMSFLRGVFKYAGRLGYITEDPTRYFERARLGEWRRWTDEELEIFHSYISTWSATNHAVSKYAFYLALYTGQRESDILDLRWKQFNFEKNNITLRQKKTGARLIIPIHPTLKSVLHTYKRDHGIPTDHGFFFLSEYIRALYKNTTQCFVPIKQDVFKTAFRRSIKAAGLGNCGLVFHGLRKNAISRLIEAGCTPNEAMAISGHASLSSLQKYVRVNQQETLAIQAMNKLVASDEKKSSESDFSS